MSEQGNWRDNGLRMSVAGDLFAALESRAAIFKELDMRTYVARPDFRDSRYAAALRELNDAMWMGLGFMSGAPFERMSLAAIDMAGLRRRAVNTSLASLAIVG